MDDVDRAFLASAITSSNDAQRPPRTAWHPLRVYSTDAAMGATVSRVYGYRADCSCGWLGRVRGTVAGCRFDIATHRADAHDGS